MLKKFHVGTSNILLYKIKLGLLQIQKPTKDSVLFFLTGPLKIATHTYITELEHLLDVPVFILISHALST